MEQPEKHYELRNRSRSRSETPQAFSRTVTENETGEHHYDLRSRSRERSMTPGEVTSSNRRSTSRSLPSSVVKARTKAMDTIEEQKDDTLTESTMGTQSKSVTKVTRKSERRLERQRVKRQLLVNGPNKLKDDSSDTKSETKEERHRESITPKRNMTSDYSSEEGDRDDNRSGSAYEFYKQQGDYWNKFPKTDYTYSQTSTCRYEVAPGVMAIPNMSRRSLRSDNSFYSSQSSKASSNEDSSTMDASEIRRNLANSVSQLPQHIRGSSNLGVIKRTYVERSTVRREEYIYDSSTDNQINEKIPSNIDSDTELDNAIVSNHTSSYLRSKNRQSIFNSIVSLTSTFIFTTLHLITFNQFKKRNYVSSTSHYYRRYDESKWNIVRRQIVTLMQYMYLSLVKVGLLDSWLLSRASNIRNRVQGRRAKILWLIFLPLLLTIGCWCIPHFMSAIPLYTKQAITKIEEIAQITESPYIREDFQSNEELRKTVNLLIARVQHLEAAKAEQFKNLSNVTRMLDDFRRSDSELWKHYDEKLLNLEHELIEQDNVREQCKSEEIDFIRVEFQTLKKLYTELKTCCDKTMNPISEEDIRKQADQVFASYFGDSFLKDDVARLFQIMNSKIHQENIEKENIEKSVDYGEHASLGVDEIRRMIFKILKIYDADKTGRVDYALESAGGQVISTRCTQLYNIHSRAFKILGMTLYYESNNPRTVIQGNTLQPGMCWAFQDFPGYLLIKLRSTIYVTGFTIEHAPRSNLPNGEMKSAPKLFNVWGLRDENDMEPVKFGEYNFLESDESLQYFPVQNKSITSPYGFVELRIHSNHGQLEYTCLYRFRVHGVIA
ncbi:klaroid protein-like isoform X2 [Phymastichus coffea]|uniref:klaroid protein-like isoform X2 n=1 Tax=Phymastichus coffea TaxID=108790 RepID=UPI00273B9043|nr:klaroid protein-like isoform X2 [Phymastichus coffea]